MSEKDEEVENLRNLVKKLQREVVEKDEELDDLEGNLEQALDSIKNFHQQQQELFENFVSLRDKYDNLKTKNMQTLWSWIPSHCSQFRTMPSMQKDVVENDKQIDRYELGSAIGRGQFAIVRTARYADTESKDILIEIVTIKQRRTNLKLGQRWLQKLYRSQKLMTCMTWNV